MKVYGSLAPEWLNSDPLPVVRPSDGVRGDMDMFPNFLPGQSGPFGILEQLVYDPRPEFTPTLTHEHNPVLADFRGQHSSWPTIEQIDVTLAHLRAGDYEYEAEHTEHAVAVLVRLRRFYRDAERVIFSSQWPEDLNQDPDPWVDFVGERFHENCPPSEGLRRFRPRDEFVPALTHETNPILADFREFGGDADMWLEYLDQPWQQKSNGEQWKPDHITHARKVLTRLRAVTPVTA